MNVCTQVKLRGVTVVEEKDYRYQKTPSSLCHETEHITKKVFKEINEGNKNRRSNTVLIICSNCHTGSHLISLHRDIHLPTFCKYH